ncbi:MAG: hypothetical protein KAT05_06855, partial [Spirochaetes bacterium]|nr:hypothetical protein [Spirochaetota bacterium]
MVFTLLYFIFPYKVEYLIPLVPWGLILLNEKLKGNYTIIVCILLLFNGIISVEVSVDDIDSHIIKLDSGLVLKNYENRKSQSIVLSEGYIESLTESLLYGK